VRRGERGEGNGKHLSRERGLKRDERNISGIEYLCVFIMFQLL
jgi:hypothetical protein